MAAEPSSSWTNEDSSMDEVVGRKDGKEESPKTVALEEKNLIGTESPQDLPIKATEDNTANEDLTKKQITIQIECTV